jgi:hypothetical protein
MSDFDPRRDPNRVGDPVNTNWEYERPSSSWGWIVGGLAVVALLLAALTASNSTPSTQISRPAAPPAPPPADQAARPTPPQPSTTGQNSQ